jgi:DNA-binding response OmpR family regulator
MPALARVLVVDDDSAVAEVLSDFFTEEGYDVRLADNGRVGLDLFDAWRPDVVLLDLRMPGMSGEDVFLRIRAMHPRAAVIFVTGADDEMVARRLLRGGATDYVKKPIDLDYCALAVLLSVARTVRPGVAEPAEPAVQSLYGLVRSVRLLDQVTPPLRQSLEQLAHAALRDALTQAPERAQTQLEMLRRCLDGASPAEISAADRATIETALASLTPTPR